MAAKKKAPSPGRIQKLVSNPGTRAALADKYLSPSQLKQRQLNQRLDTPVTPGSSLTGRDLAHQANAATTVQYGPQQAALNTKLAQTQQLGNDTAGWYDQFKAELQKHQDNIAANGQAAQDGVRAQTGAVGALGAATAQGTGAVLDDAQKATAIRQALSGSFGAMVTAQSKNANDYADTMTHVVAPGQKLTALNQSAKNAGSVRDQLTELAKEQGAYGAKFRSDTVANEQKSVLAQQALTGKTAEQQTKDMLTAGASGGKYGYTPSEWLALSPSQRTQIVKDNKPKTKGSDMGKVNSYGYTEKDWRALSTAERQKVIKDFKKTGKKGAASSPVSGPGSLPSATEANRVSQVNKVYDALRTGKVQSKDPITGAVTIKTLKPSLVLEQFQAQHIDPNVLNVARSLYHNNGKLGKWGVDAAHHAGVHVSGNWEIV
jgi:hypothetical protein